MKADIIFLRTLNKELRFLKNEEKEKFISEYRLKIDEKYQKGETLNKIIASFDSPKQIAKQIYDESGFNIENLTKKSNSNSLPLKWVNAILSVIPQTIIFSTSIILMLGGIITGIGTIAVFILCWLNFDPLQAIGVSILALGLLPLIGLALLWIGRIFFKFESFIFKFIWNSLSLKELNTKQAKTTTKPKKVFMIIIMSVCTLLVIGGSVGTFAGKKTIGGSAISGELLHTQTETLNIANLITENEAIKINYESLKRISWYMFTLVEDYAMESNIEINRAHNTKENLTLEYTIKKQDNNYALNVKMPWNLLIFNISSNKFTIKYDPRKVDFTNVVS